MKVTIFGWHHKKDSQFFDQYTQSNLKITQRCGILAYKENTKIWHQVWDECKNEDLVIIPSFGVLSSHWKENIHHYEPYFSKIKNIAYWSMDSHHDTGEKYIRQYFKYWLVAHRGYESNTGTNTVHIPLCYWQNGYNEFFNVIKKTTPSSDVVFHHNSYSVGNRNTLIEQIKSHINELNLNYNFSKLNGGPENPEYTLSLEGCRVGLNISLLNDFNFRNFEVWMANKPLLTNYIDDYDLFPELKANTIFYKRDLSDFKEKLQESLTTKVNTRRYIIKDHMITSRYIAIINTIMSEKFKITFPEE